MANPWEGEVAIRIDGTRHVMKLTLGALAELENELGHMSLVSLVERFESGGFSARDVLSLIVAGLHGGGWSGDVRDLMTADIEGGVSEAAKLAGQLLVRAFSFPEE